MRLPVCHREEGSQGRERVEPSAKRWRIFQSVRSLMEIRNYMRSRTLPWHSTAFTGRGEERVLLRVTRWLQKWRKSLITEEWCWPWIPCADSLQSKAGCQTVKKTSRYVQRDGPDLMSDIEALHHCWRVEATCPR